jgi:hypothetical protein
MLNVSRQLSMDSRLRGNDVNTALSCSPPVNH